MRNERGQTLVSVMLGVGITGVVTLGVAGFMARSQQMGQQTKSGFEAERSLSTAGHSMSSQSICRAVIFSADPAPAAVVPIPAPTVSSPRIITDEKALANAGLPLAPEGQPGVVSAALEPLMRDDAVQSDDDKDGLLYNGQLSVVFRVTSNRTVTRTIPVLLKKNAAGQLIDCGRGSDDKGSGSDVVNATYQLARVPCPSSQRAIGVNPDGTYKCQVAKSATKGPAPTKYVDCYDPSMATDPRCEPPSNCADVQLDPPIVCHGPLDGSCSSSFSLTGLLPASCHLVSIEGSTHASGYASFCNVVNQPFSGLAPGNPEVSLPFSFNGKGSVVTISLDASQSSVTFSNRTWGFSSAGGYACISDVHLVLHSARN